MLVRFSSIETESITMFGDVAVQLIKMMGASGAIPGAVGAEDIRAAVTRLRQQLQTGTAPDPEPSDSEGDKGDGRDGGPRIALATRAKPLIDLLERADAAKVPLMWESS